MLHRLKGARNMFGKGLCGWISLIASKAQDTEVTLRLRNVDRKDGKAVLLSLGKIDREGQDGQGAGFRQVIDNA